MLDVLKLSLRNALRRHRAHLVQLAVEAPGKALLLVFLAAFAAGALSCSLLGS